MRSIGSRITMFACADSGAVTVDWVVLAAAVVGLGVGTVGAVRTGVVGLGSDIDASLSTASVVAMGGLGDLDVVASAAAYHFVPEDTDWWLDQMSAYASTSDADLLSAINYMSGQVAYATANNMQSYSEHRLNYLVIARAEAESRSLPWPDGAQSFADSWSQYHTAFPPE